MCYRSLLLILGLVAAVPVFGQPISKNEIGPGSVPANIYDAVEPVQERQIIDDRPHIRDFRKAPEVPESFRGEFKEIPARTKVMIVFDTPVNSDTSKPGDNFSVRTLEPIADTDGYVVLPSGAVIKGTVTRASEWTSDQHILKDGKMQLRFDSIEAIGFASTSMIAELVSHGGVIHCTRNSANISYDTPMPNSRTLVSTFLAKKGKIIDVRAGDQFRLSFPDGLRMFRRL